MVTLPVVASTVATSGVVDANDTTLLPAAAGAASVRSAAPYVRSPKAFEAMTSAPFVTVKVAFALIAS